MHGLALHLIHLVVYAAAVLIAARIVPGIRVRSFGSALLFAFAFAVLDKLLFTLLVIVSFPAVVLTFGLFILVINAFLFWLADKLVDGVEVDGAWPAFLGALVTSLLNTAALWMLGA
jgi:putative membrane protein